MPIVLELTVHAGAHGGTTHRFERDIVKIGRLASAHLKLEDPKVSRIHAVIEATSDGTGYAIIDMGSTEGTLVNGEKVSKHRLADGDEILVGETRVSVAIGAGTSVEAPAPAVAAAAVAGASGDVVHSSDVVETADEPVAPAPAAPAPAAAPVAAAAVAPPTAGPEAYAPTASPQPLSAAPELTVPPASGYGPPPGFTAPPAGYPAEAFAGSQLPYPQPVYDTQAPYSYMVPDPWGTVPNNLASEGVPDTDRELEVKLLWGVSVLDTLNVFDTPTLTMGDERKVSGFGPFQKFVHCDLELPSNGLPQPTWLLAEAAGKDVCNYTINIPAGWEGQVERADGTIIPLEHLRHGGQGAEPGDLPGSLRYHLQSEETLYIAWEHVVVQVRYIRKTQLVPPPLASRLNYAWLNILVLAFFFHIMAIVSFIATPRTQAELTEDIFKNPNRFAQFRLTPEQKKRAEKNSLLQKLRAGAKGAKAKGKQGKAGRKDKKVEKDGRMAAKGDPDKKDIAKGALDKLFGGAQANTRRSYLFGSGGLGGKLEGALGGVTGTEVGDASGLGGLGSRGGGLGGGGLSMDSVGIGVLGTKGRGGGGEGTDYGSGAAGLGKKVERDINISPGSPIIMGSLDKDLIRRVIKQHLAQIRYCYEKELVRSPGLYGKVATQFTISGNGRVQSAKVTQSTLGNAEVERCITAKIRTWKFPKPKGGGIVIVKYPFIFKTSG